MASAMRFDLDVLPSWAPGRRAGWAAVGRAHRFRQRDHQDRATEDGVPSVHPLDERELRGLRRLQKASQGRYVFSNERGASVTEAAFRKTLARIAATVPCLAGLNVHAHMLRHSCGYALANRGMDTRSLQHFLGHRDIQNTVIYTTMAADRFDKVWDKP
jgi:site-specific recombinase XerD